MNTFQLRCFLAVANTLNFARAAQQMNISQPAITHQIKSLETELNVKLFHRSTRLVEITPEGQSFLADARSMIAISEQAKLRFSDPNDKPIEKLSIGCGSYYQLMLLSESLHELADTFPNLHPQLSVVPHEQLYRLLDNGGADLVFDIQDDAKDTSRLTFLELQKIPIGCFCRANHPLSNTECVSISELRSQPLIFCNPINLIPEIARLQWKLAEERNSSDMHFCDSIEAAAVLAEAGFGVAVLPELFLQPNSRLRTLRLADAPMLAYGVFYKPYPGDGVLRKFIHIIKRQLIRTGTGSVN